MDEDQEASLPPLLTTRAAAAYCGFKTTGALRKARLEGRIQPAGRRGGTGTWMWSRVELHRFLTGGGVAKLAAERSGAPSAHGDAHEEEGMEVGPQHLDLVTTR